MSENNSDYEKKLAQASAARQRQFERQKAKLACPEYQQKRLEKQKQAHGRALERQQQRVTDPQYLNEQRDKQLQATERQRQRLRIKESDPEYIKTKAAKKLEQARVQQQKAIHKVLENQSAESFKDQTKKSASKGMKGRTPNAVEKRLANKIAEIGCICCLNKGWYTTEMQQQETTKFVSLHHIDGRTKEWAHARVLPLCAYHHDTPAPADAPEELTPIHRGNKKEWEMINGTEATLLKQVYDIIQEPIPWR